MAALSFCYAPPVSGQYIQYHEDETTILSDLKELCQKIMTARGCQISVVTTKSTKQLGSNTEYNLSLTGPAQALMEARGDLLASCPLEVRIKLKKNKIIKNLYTDCLVDQAHIKDPSNFETIFVGRSFRESRKRTRNKDYYYARKAGLFFAHFR